VLVAGVALGAAAFAVAGLVNSFAVFVAMYAVAGLGNTAYHPADYSLLSQHSTPARIGQIFSFHTFSGILGAAVAPATLLAMQSRFGWRGAYIGAAVLGVAVLALLISQRPTLADRLSAARHRHRAAPTHRRTTMRAGGSCSRRQSWSISVSSF
jgi:FSR family fosmidomycin resistance protein-like MFS transporter